ncbi:MAG: PorP/SprF family type IX secretion system membrane protein [Bacteroidales bacterium]
MLATALLLLNPKLSGQDPGFSHFVMSPMYYNPASCGGQPNDLQVRMSYRNQWYGLKSAFNTGLFSADIYDPYIGALGVLALSDTEGEGSLHTSQIGACYAHKYPVIAEQLSIHLGLMACFVQKSIDWSKIHFDDEFDKVLGQVYPSGFVPPARSSVIYPDFNTGILITSNLGRNYHNRHRFYNEIGFSMSHITRPDYSLLGINSRLPIKYVFHFKGIYNKYERQDFFISPALMIEQQASMRTVTYGSNIVFNQAFIGLWIRNRQIAAAESFDAVSVCAGVVFETESRSQVIVSYNYDFTVSPLKSGTLGSHEVNVFWKMTKVHLSGKSSGRQVERQRQKPVPCPGSGRAF